MRLTRLALAWVLLLALPVVGVAAPPVPPAISVVGGNATLAVTTATARVVLPVSVATFPVVQLINDGAVEAFVAQGDVTVVATTASIPLPPGATIAFYPAFTTAYVAAITATGSTTLRVLQWNGAPFYVNAATSGTVTATTNADGTIAPGTAPAKELVGGCVYNSTQPGPTTTQALATQCDENGNARISTHTVGVCVTPTLTAATYGANVVMGGLLTFTNLFGPKGSGIIESVAVTSKTVQTAGLLLFPFAANPTTTVGAGGFADHGAAAINVADVASVRTPQALNTPHSNLGTHTEWGNVGIGQAINMGAGNTSGYAILVPTATTSAFGTTDLQVCMKVLQD